MKIHVLHENAVWVEPLRQAFADLDLPFEDWSLVDGTVVATLTVFEDGEPRQSLERIGFID